MSYDPTNGLNGAFLRAFARRLTKDAMDACGELLSWRGIVAAEASPILGQSDPEVQITVIRFDGAKAARVFYIGTTKAAMVQWARKELCGG